MATITINRVETTISAIDQLGVIKAQIAELKTIEKHLSDEIAARGAGAYEGASYRATVSEVPEGQSLDVKAAEEKLRELGVDGRWFSKHQKTRAAYTTVKVVARTT